MSEYIWDKYANWSEVATQDSTSDLKVKITGNRKWSPNHVSDELKFFFETVVLMHRYYKVSATLLDFGCGLGRNAPMLRHFFPRLLGLDTPEMIQRLKSVEMRDVASLYDNAYDDLDLMVEHEQFHILYDSVVFQHLVSVPYVTSLLSKLLKASSFTTVVSLKHHGGAVYETVAQRFLREQGWKITSLQDDTKSFGAAHNLIVMQRR